MHGADTDVIFVHQQVGLRCTSARVLQLGNEHLHVVHERASLCSAEEVVVGSELNAEVAAYRRDAILVRQRDRTGAFEGFALLME